MSATTLLDEFQYYLDHQADLSQKYQGRYVVIKENRLLGDYKTASEAVRETAKEHKPGTFLVQRCDADPQSTTQTFHSRVTFA